MTVPRALYRWPAAAAFGRVVPKGDIYRHGKVSASLKERFVTEVERITWAYTLAERTINLPGNDAVPEIQVFTVEARGSDVANSVLAAIDRAVQTPIIFEIIAGGGLFACTRMAVSPKSATRAGGSYYSTEWIETATDRVALPTAISLPNLFTAILQRLAGVAAAPGAAVSEVSARLADIRAAEKQLAALMKRMHAERQFNRRVELHREVKQKQRELDELRQVGSSPRRGGDAVAPGGQA